MKSYKNIDEYTSNFPVEVQVVLGKIRKTIRTVAPDAKEKISYGIPTFTSGGNIVHFAAYETHIGFYPGAAAIVEFKNELKPYETSKGTVRFPIDQPVPLNLIEKITRFRVEQNLKKKFGV